MKILIADYSPHIRKEIKSIIALNCKCEIIESNTYGESIRLIENESPSLVIANHIILNYETLNLVIQQQKLNNGCKTKYYTYGTSKNEMITNDIKYKSLSNDNLNNIVSNILRSNK